MPARLFPFVSLDRLPCYSPTSSRRDSDPRRRAPLTRVRSEEAMDDTFYVSDDELHVPFLPQLYPRCVTISRQYILDLALKRLGLVIENTKVTDAGDGELYASISLYLSAHTNMRAAEPEVFHGGYATTKELAIESASSVALTFLKDRSMIYVDDANYHELKTCQHKLLAASSWAMIFEDHTRDLQKKMSKMSQGTGNGSNEVVIASDCDDINSTCPLPLIAQGTAKQQTTPPPSTYERQTTPPPKLDGSSKQAGKHAVHNVRKDLFGERKRDCGE